MAGNTALAAQFGYKAETTFGTPVTVTDFWPIVRENLDRVEPEGESGAIIANKTVHTADQVNGGPVTVGGDVITELWQLDNDVWLEQLLGSKTGSGTTATPWIFTSSLTGRQGKGMTVQVGRPDIGGTVRAFTYAGCKVSKLTIDVQPGAGEQATAKATWSVIGTAEPATGTALATASYTSGLQPFKFHHLAVTVGGSPVNTRRFSLTIDNRYQPDSRRVVGSKFPLEPLMVDRMMVTGTLDGEFTDLTQYNRFVNKTDVALVATFTSGAKVIAITMNVRAQAGMPMVDGPGVLGQPFPFRALATSAGADSTALSISVAES